MVSTSGTPADGGAVYDLSRFTLADMTRCGVALRRMGMGASSMEEVSDRLVRYLYERFQQPDGASACALVRLFVTLPYASLEPSLQQFARDVSRTDLAPTTKCLTLLGTAGDESEWNARRTSAGHQALPLVSEHSVARSPMIAQLIQQLGVEIKALLGDPQLLMDAEQHSFNVFYVPAAQGSPYIPAQQQFVKPYRVQSVLGFGGLLPTGEMYATILFSKMAIPRESAELFKPLALNVKVALLPFAGGKVFS